MAFILGMDTGGTYTDGVVIDSAGRNIICKAKALTTREDLDRDEIRNALLQMKGRVEAIAVSGYASVRNPKHEKEVGRMAQELLDVPVVCAHQLTSALGFHHRTVTAVLNGRLIPIIRQLLRSTKEVLREKNIHAQLLVVKGDGTLMTEAVAKERPIETIFRDPRPA